MPTDPQLLTGLGAVASIGLAACGSALASAHAGIFAVKFKPYKNFVPIIISGVLAIYGIIISIILVGKLEDDVNELSQVAGYRNLSAGLACGLACLASGFGVAKFVKQLNAGEHAVVNAQADTTGVTEPLIAGSRTNNTSFLEPDFIKMCMVLCYLEAIGLYGLVVALFLIGK